MVICGKVSVHLTTGGSFKITPVYGIDVIPASVHEAPCGFAYILRLMVAFCALQYVDCWRILAANVLRYGESFLCYTSSKSGHTQ